LFYVSERLKGNSKEHYHLDALTCDARDDWVAAFQALRLNCIIAALQRNDPAVTAVGHDFDAEDAEDCIAFCSALVGNSNVVKTSLSFRGFRSIPGFVDQPIECGASVSQMLRRNSSLLDVKLSGEMMLESLKKSGGMQT
jgi:hypothetical protein